MSIAESASPFSASPAAVGGEASSSASQNAPPKKVDVAKKKTKLQTQVRT